MLALNGSSLDGSPLRWAQIVSAPRPAVWRCTRLRRAGVRRSPSHRHASRGAERHGGEPDRGPASGGTVLTVTGTNFSSGATVRSAAFRRRGPDAVETYILIANTSAFGGWA